MKTNKIKPLLKAGEWLVFIGLVFFSFLIISPLLPLKNAPRTHIIVTGSMEPTIKAGSITLTKPVDPAIIKPGDIIAFASPFDPKDTILHRVDSISGADPLTFKTKGDANNSIDDWDVSASGVLGIHFFSIPYLGYAGSFVKTLLGFCLIIGIPALLFIVFQIFNIKKAIKEQIESEIKKRQSSSTKKIIAGIFFLFFTLSTVSLLATKALFSDQISVSGLTISIADFVPPPAPSLISPTNNSFKNVSSLVMDWSGVTDYQNQHDPVYYIYQLCTQPDCFVPYYESPHLSQSFFNDPGTPEGIYYWHVRACDSLDRCSDWTLPWKITIDNSSPIVTVNSPSDGQYVLGITPINITVTDAHLSHYWLVIENSNGKVVAGPGTVTQATSLINQTVYTWNPVSLPEGDYTIKLEARDLAGNKTPNLAPVPVDPKSPTDSVDWITVHINNPPSTPTGLTIKNNLDLDIGCSGYVNDRQITVDWNDNTESDFGYYNYDTKDQNNFKQLTSSQYSSQVSDEDGQYKYRVSAVDKAGFESSKTEWCYVTLDRSAPVTTILNPNNVGSTDVYVSYNKDVAIDFSITDTNPNYAKLYYSLDLGVSWVEAGTSNQHPLGTFNFDLLTLAVDTGTICFDTVGYDLAGNFENNTLTIVTNPLSADTYCIYFDISDVVKPTSQIASPFLSSKNQIGITMPSWDGYIAGIAFDDKSGVSRVDLSIQKDGSYYWNGTSWIVGDSTSPRVTATGTNSWQYQIPSSSLSDGVYQITSHAVDNAGNIENSASIRFVYRPIPAPVQPSLADVQFTYDPSSHMAHLTFINIPQIVTSYRLIYLSNGQEKGIESNIDKLDHYLGSCSDGGACTPDPLDGQITITVDKLIKEIHL